MKKLFNAHDQWSLETFKNSWFFASISFTIYPLNFNLLWAKLKLYFESSKALKFNKKKFERTTFEPGKAQIHCGKRSDSYKTIFLVTNTQDQNWIHTQFKILIFKKLKIFRREIEFNWLSKFFHKKSSNFPSNSGLIFNF